MDTEGAGRAKRRRGEDAAADEGKADIREREGVKRESASFPQGKTLCRRADVSSRSCSADVPLASNTAAGQLRSTTYYTTLAKERTPTATYGELRTSEGQPALSSFVLGEVAESKLQRRRVSRESAEPCGAAAKKIARTQAKLLTLGAQR